MASVFILLSSWFFKAPRQRRHPSVVLGRRQTKGPPGRGGPGSSTERHTALQSKPTLPATLHFLKKITGHHGPPAESAWKLCCSSSWDMGLSQTQRDLGPSAPAPQLGITRPHQAPPRTLMLGTSLVSSHAHQYVQLSFLLCSIPGSSDVTTHLLLPQQRMGPILDRKCEHQCGRPRSSRVVTKPEVWVETAVPKAGGAWPSGSLPGGRDQPLGCVRHTPG